MAELTTSGVVREILTNDPEIKAEEAIRLAKARGLRVPDEKIRHSIHNQRNSIREKVAAATKLAPTAARETTPPKATPVESEAVLVVAAASPGLAGVLANVALVNKIVGLCGGVENAREAAEAVQACGGTEAFLQHLELVASIRDSE
ncbi:MAG: hypothetical protein K8U57_13180 [Planctomycetes bacterium]|nr:hypothetical protein [Planctomycetota bacterium]